MLKPIATLNYWPSVWWWGNHRPPVQRGGSINRTQFNAGLTVLLLVCRECCFDTGYEPMLPLLTHVPHAKTNTITRPFNVSGHQHRIASIIKNLKLVRKISGKATNKNSVAPEIHFSKDAVMNRSPERTDDLIEIIRSNVAPIEEVEVVRIVDQPQPFRQPPLVIDDRPVDAVIVERPPAIVFLDKNQNPPTRRSMPADVTLFEVEETPPVVIPSLTEPGGHPLPEISFEAERSNDTRTSDAELEQESIPSDSAAPDDFQNVKPGYSRRDFSLAAIGIGIGLVGAMLSSAICFETSSLFGFGWNAPMLAGAFSVVVGGIVSLFWLPLGMKFKCRRAGQGCSEEVTDGRSIWSRVLSVEFVVMALITVSMGAAAAVAAAMNWPIGMLQFVLWVGIPLSTAMAAIAISEP